MKNLTARQIASMTPEARERYEKKLKIVTLSLIHISEPTRPY